MHKIHSFLELKDIEFHDQSLNSMEFDLMNQKIMFAIELFDNDLDDYKNLKLSFSGVRSLHFENFQLEKVTDIEIASFDFKKLDNGFSADLIFLLDFGLASFRIEFVFEEFTLKWD